MLPQLANTNCIIAHHLTDCVFKKTQDKTSIAVSCGAQTPCRKKTAHQGQGQFLQIQRLIIGLPASLAVKREWAGPWTSLSCILMTSCRFKALIDLEALLPRKRLNGYISDGHLGLTSTLAEVWRAQKMCWESSRAQSSLPHLLLAKPAYLSTMREKPDWSDEKPQAAIPSPCPGTSLDNRLQDSFAWPLQ